MKNITLLTSLFILTCLTHHVHAEHYGDSTRNSIEIEYQNFLQYKDSINNRIKKTGVTTVLKSSLNNEIYLDSVITYRPESNGDSTVIERLIRKYNADNLLLEETTWYFSINRNCWRGRSKQIYEYDEYDNITLDAYYNHYDDDLEVWYGYMQYNFEYASNGDLLAEERYFEYDWEKHIWSYISRAEYTYLNGKTQTYSTFSFDHNKNQFTPYVRYEYEHDTAGIEQNRLYFLWDTIQQDWNINVHYHFIYPDTIDARLVYKYVWNDGAEDSILTQRTIESKPSENVTIYHNQRWLAELQLWENIDWRKTEIIENHVVAEHLKHWNKEDNSWLNLYKHGRVFYNEWDYTHWFYTWNIDSAGWVANQKLIHQHDSAGNEILMEKYIRYEPTDPWQGIWHDEYRSNEQGLQIYFSSSRWDAENQIWYYDRKVEYTYNDAGQQTSYSSSDWNNDSLEWKETFFQENIYDETGKQISHHSMQWSNMNNIWSDFKDAYYYYSDHQSTNNFKQLDQLELKITIKDQIIQIENNQIGLLKLQINNYQGQTINRLALNTGSNIIEIHNLKSGIYIGTIYSEHKKSSFRFSRF